MSDLYDEDRALGEALAEELGVPYFPCEEVEPGVLYFPCEEVEPMSGGSR
jgi:hypothetical protein